MMRRSGPNVTLKKITGLSFIVALGFVTFVTSEGKSKSLNSSNIGQQESASDKTAEQVYKNIQVLKDLRASDLDGVMTFMSAALGVGCTYCHTNPWESDQKSAKLAARRMIQMTRAINVEHFSGNLAVTVSPVIEASTTPFQIHRSILPWEVRRMMNPAQSKRPFRLQMKSLTITCAPLVMRLLSLRLKRGCRMEPRLLPIE